MAKSITSTTKFASRGGNPAHGLALIYDLEGFSKFFNQPDVQDYVPKFLNHLSQAISVVLLGGTAYWDSFVQKYDVGFCINLASRLQKYCADLGFIVSARLGLPDEFVTKEAYKRVVATKIRGFPEEIVIVDKEEYERLPEAQRASLFRDL